MPTAVRDLNDVMDFDHVVEVLPGRSVVHRGDLYAPECFEDAGEIDTCGDRRWTALDGYSGQQGYSGPIMHESELIGGRMADDILSEPGVYVAVVVDDLDEPEHPAGWAVLQMDGAH